MDNDQLIQSLQQGQSDSTKEVKVNLPLTFLIKLHGIKLLEGTTISATVTRALAAYFAAIESEDEGPAAVAAEGEHVPA